MIRPININLNAAHPELKLLETVTYTGSPSSVFIRGIPPNYGRWAITAVFVAASFPDGSTTTRTAVQSADGVWVATLPATATSGRTENGFRVIADGIDENGEAATGYIIAVADFAVASLDVTPAPEPGETSYQMLYFDEVPSTLRKGDAAKIDGVLKFYNGSAWEPFAAPPTLDDAVTRTSANAVKSSGIWSAIWGALSALPTGFSSLYGWCVAQIAKLRGKTDLNVYGYGNASVTFPDGFDITYDSETYTAPSGGETIEFYGPITSTAVPQYNFWVPYEYKDATNFDPAAQTVWCLYGSIGNSAPSYLMYRAGASYSIANWNTVDPTLTLSYGEATGDAPTMARPLGTTGDTLVKMSQMNTALANKQNALSQTQLANVAAVSDALAFDATHSYAKGDPVVYNGTLYTFTAAHTGAWTGTDVSAVDIVSRLAGKANDNAVVHLEGDETVGGSKAFTGQDTFYDLTISHPQGNGFIRFLAQPNENRVQIDFSDPASGSMGSLLLPIMPTSAGTLAVIENIAPDAFGVLYDGVTVEPYTLYCYQGRLYRCILGYTFQSGDSYPPDDPTHWTTATVEDVLAALRAALAGKADVSAIPYNLVTKTISNGAVSLDDRAINAVAVSSSLASLTVNFPSATSGKARDFGLRLTVASGVTTAPELALPQGVTCENADGEAPEIGADGAATILYFTETASGVFLVKGEVITAIS